MPEVLDAQSAPEDRRIWDPIVRIGHWLLAAAFFTSWLTGDEWMQVHVVSGYTIAAILLVRFVWGWLGPRNARFSSFVRGPRAVLRYLKSLAGGSPEAHRGHNPAGGWMIVALLLALAIQVSSGMMLYAIEDGAGPLAGWVATESIASRSDHHQADSRQEHGEGHEDEREEFWEELHELGANALMLLVALHLAGVLVASLVHRENLIRSMVTGQRDGGEAVGEP